MCSLTKRKLLKRQRTKAFYTIRRIENFKSIVNIETSLGTFIANIYLILFVFVACRYHCKYQKISTYTFQLFLDIFVVEYIAIVNLRKLKRSLK